MKIVFNIFLTASIVVMAHNTSGYYNEYKEYALEREGESNLMEMEATLAAEQPVPEKVTIRSIENAPNRHDAMILANEYINNILSKDTLRGDLSVDLSFLNIPTKYTTNLNVAKELAAFKFNPNRVPKKLPGAIKLTTYEIDENHNRIKGSLLSFENREDFVDFLKCTFAAEAALNNSN